MKISLDQSRFNEEQDMFDGNSEMIIYCPTRTDIRLDRYSRADHCGRERILKDIKISGDILKKAIATDIVTGTSRRVGIRIKNKQHYLATIDEKLKFDHNTNQMFRTYIEIFDSIKLIERKKRELRRLKRRPMALDISDNFVQYLYPRYDTVDCLPNITSLEVLRCLRPHFITTTRTTEGGIVEILNTKRRKDIIWYPPCVTTDQLDSITEEERNNFVEAELDFDQDLTDFDLDLINLNRELLDLDSSDQNQEILLEKKQSRCFKHVSENPQDNFSSLINDRVLESDFDLFPTDIHERLSSEFVGQKINFQMLQQMHIRAKELLRKLEPDAEFTAHVEIVNSSVIHISVELPDLERHPWESEYLKNRHKTTPTWTFLGSNINSVASTANQTASNVPNVNLTTASSAATTNIVFADYMDLIDHTGDDNAT